ncbi:MAG: lipid II flippase MurJ [Brachybacterium sp.]|nr:lipid II flippase MurJ [Brachybacterium sp.]
MSQTTATIVRAAGMILVITVAARIAGFVRYLVFGASVGGGDVGTAYASANLLPNVLFEVIAGGALAAVVVPLVAGLVENDTDGTGKSTADRVVSALFTWMLVITVPLMLAVILLAEPLAALILSGATDAGIDLAAHFLRIFAVQLPLYGVAVVLGAYLQARKRFFWPALIPLISSLVVMATYGMYALLTPAVTEAGTISAGARAWLGWGTTGGVLAMALPLLWPARRAGLRLRPTLRMPSGMGRRALGLAGAGLGAVGAQQLTVGLVLLVAMRAGGTGTLPVFQYAQALYLLPFAVLVVPLVTSVFPHLSEQRLVGDAAAFASTAAGSLRATIAVAVIGAAALIGAAPALEQFFRLIDRANVEGVGSTVAALALGLVPYAIAHQCTRILSAALRARDALIVGSVGWIVAALLIGLIVASGPSRGTAEAATAFGLAIAAGMSVSALLGVARISEVIDSPPQMARLVRSGVAAVVAFALGGVGGYLISRPLVHSNSSMGMTLGVGVLAGVVAMLLVLAVLALADRESLLRIRDAIRRRRDRTASGQAA